MSYPNSKPRKLHRSRNDRWVGGVCGGLAEFLNMDATLVRVLVVVLAVFTAAFPVALVYLAMMLLVPEAPPGPPSSIGPRNRHPGAGQYGTSQYGWTASNQRPAEDPVWGAAGAPWQQSASSTPPPPQQSADDLFSRAKHPTQPSDGRPTESKPDSGSDS